MSDKKQKPERAEAKTSEASKMKLMMAAAMNADCQEYPLAGGRRKPNPFVFLTQKQRERMESLGMMAGGKVDVEKVRQAALATGRPLPELRECSIHELASIIERHRWDTKGDQGEATKPKTITASTSQAYEAYRWLMDAVDGSECWKWPRKHEHIVQHGPEEYRNYCDGMEPDSFRRQVKRAMNVLTVVKDPGKSIVKHDEI